MNRLKLLGAIALVMLVGFTVAAGDALAANIVIINNDGPGEGFNDATAAAPVGGNWGTTIGQQRLIAFEYAAGIWGACLDSPVDIEILAQFNPQFCDAGSAVLGSAGTINAFRDFAGAPQAGTWYNTALANSLAGFDLDPGVPDINATFNSNLNGDPGCLGGIGWYYGLDGNPGGDIDFVSVLLHEMAHGIGFQTFVNQAGQKALGFNDQYMVFLENHGAVPADYPSMTDAQRAAANIADPNLHWTGPLVTAEGNAILGGGISNGHVRMHGPNPYQPGSSVSHWSTALSPNELMEPSYTGPNHDPGLAWTLMEEIGWNFVDKVTDGCDTPQAPIDLASPTGTYSPDAPDDFQDRGVFVTAIKRFDVCSIGIEGDFIPGETLTANIYAADGTTRGALLATASATVEFAGMRTHFIPINYQLQECEEYDIAVEWEHATAWPWWSELDMTERPYDVGGVIRVRDGEQSGGAGNFALAHFTIQGSSSAAENQNNVAATHDCNNTFGSEHGAFITAKKTHSVCALGVRVNFAAAPGTVRAYIYESSANVRGALVAEGTAVVPSTGGLIITVPINAVLREGQQYNIGFMYSESTFRYCHLEAYPWEFGDLWTIDAKEKFGVVDGGTAAVPAFRVSWSEGAGGELLDLVKPWYDGVPLPPQNHSQDLVDYGVYVSATKNSEVYSLGWYADVLPGEVIGVNVYEAVGTTRGALIASGTMASGQGGLRWHDVPVSVSLIQGQDYDLEVDIGQVEYWDCHDDRILLPYNAYGILDIVDGESNGSAGNFCLIDIRIGACKTVATGVDDGPAVPPRFALAAPYPNPVSGQATLGFSLDEAASVSVAVFDVKGRKVADLIQDQRFPVGPSELVFDGTSVPSGVYFVKMSTATQSVSRKITIVR